MASSQHTRKKKKKHHQRHKKPRLAAQTGKHTTRTKAARRRTRNKAVPMEQRCGWCRRRRGVRALPRQLAASKARDDATHVPKCCRSELTAVPTVCATLQVTPSALMH